MSVAPFSAVLLAGGRSSRMGVDKANLEIEGVALWRRQMATLAAAGADEIFISGDPARDWDGWPGAVLADDEPEIGPLSGLITGLRAARFPLVLVLAVDMPGMTADGLRKLLQWAKPPTDTVPGCGVVPCRGDRFYEPLAAVYPRETLVLAKTCRDEGCFAVQEFAARAIAQGLVSEKRILPEEEELFANLNTPQAWRNFLRKRNT